MDHDLIGPKALPVAIRDLGNALVELSRSLAGVLPADIAEPLGDLGDALLRYPEASSK